jgi:hypothetical protein
MSDIAASLGSDDFRRATSDTLPSELHLVSLSEESELVPGLAFDVDSDMASFVFACEDW